jgi:hypothetical protein
MNYTIYLKTINIFQLYDFKTICSNILGWLKKLTRINVNKIIFNDDFIDSINVSLNIVIKNKFNKFIYDIQNIFIFPSDIILQINQKEKELLNINDPRLVRKFKFHSKIYSFVASIIDLIEYNKMEDKLKYFEESDWNNFISMN